MNDDLEVDGLARFHSNLSVDGNLSVLGNLVVTGTTSMEGGMSLTGDLDMNDNDILDVDRIGEGDVEGTEPYLDFNTQDNELAVMAGNVGIGIANPTQKLEVYGDIFILIRVRMNR